MSDQPTLTPTQLGLLRSALGLSAWNTKPTRNWLQGDLTRHADDIKELQRLGYMEPTQFHGPGGMEFYMKCTEAGIQYVNEHLPNAAPTNLKGT